MNLSDNDKEIVAKEITTIFDYYDSGRFQHLDDIEVLQSLIYEAPKSSIQYGEDYVIPTMYKLNDTLISYLTNSIYPTHSGMFGVKGKNKESEGNAQDHKYDLVNTLDTMKFKNRISNESLKLMCLSGELIAFVKTSETKKKSKKVKTLEDFGKEYSANENAGDINPYTIEESSHTIVDIDVIDSEDFVFDVTQTDNFDACPKIIRKYANYRDVVGNEAYDISKEDKEHFRQLTANKKVDYSDMVQDSDIRARSTVKGSKLEVLEFWGNIDILNGDEEIFLEDYVVVVVAGRVVRCEENPFLVNPIVFHAPIVCPENKRGISPLRAAIIPNILSTNAINEMMNCVALVTNPPFLVEKDTVVGKKIEISPGKAIVWETQVGTTGAPSKMDFSSGVTACGNVIPVLDRHIQEATGLSDNLSGVLSDTKRTATELNLASSGSSVRINNLSDSIKFWNIKLIETIATVKANTEFDDSEVMINRDGKAEPLTINSDIRQGDYEYTITDSKTEIERKQGFDAFLSFCQLFLKADPSLINLRELFKKGAGMQNVSNIDDIMEKSLTDKAIEDFAKTNNLPIQPADYKVITDKLSEFIPQAIQALHQPQGETNGQGAGNIQSQPSPTSPEQGLANSPQLPDQGSLPQG